MRRKSWYLLLVTLLALGGVLAGCVYQMPAPAASAQQPGAAADVEADADVDANVDAGVAPAEGFSVAVHGTGDDPLLEALDLRVVETDCESEADFSDIDLPWADDILRIEGQ